jgi:hypothetical protein
VRAAAAPELIDAPPMIPSRYAESMKRIPILIGLAFCLAAVAACEDDLPAADEGQAYLCDVVAAPTAVEYGVVLRARPAAPPAAAEGERSICGVVTGATAIEYGLAMPVPNAPPAR